MDLSGWYHFFADRHMRRRPRALGLRLRRLIVVHRHGDRAPSYNPSLTETESLYWHSHRHRGNAAAARCFPVRSEAGTAPLDAERAPFGSLTTRGAAQLREVGARLAAWYGLGGSARELLASGGSVACTASNFHRTQASAQQLLTGLLAHAGAGADGGAALPDRLRCSVRVAPSPVCNVDPWGRGPVLGELTKRLATTREDFLAREHALMPVRRELCARIPFFAGHPKAEPDSPEASSTFMWIRAADYFTSRAAHGADSAIVDDEGNGNTDHGSAGGGGDDSASLRWLPGTRQHMRASLDHVLWRFATWYRDPTVLQEASGGLLGEIAAAVGAPSPAAPAVTVVGGHDVTLLPLLFALGHWSTPEEAVWPPYGSSLCFEEVEPVSGVWAREARGLLDTIEAAKPPTGAGDGWQCAFERRHGAEICVGTADDGTQQDWLGPPFWEPFRNLTGEREVCVNAMAAHLSHALALPVHSAGGSGTWVRAMLNFQPVAVFGLSAVHTQEFCDRVDGLFGGGLGEDQENS